MKYCPNCKNKGFKPSEGFNKPLVSKGKQNFINMAVRYYYCVNCGTRFKTVEKLLEYVGEQTLFDATEQPNGKQR